MIDHNSVINALSIIINVSHVSRQHICQVPGRTHRPDVRVETGGGASTGEGAGECSQGGQTGEVGGQYW